MFEIPDEIIREVAERNFRGGANSPFIWSFAANRLFTAADLLSLPIKEAQDRELKRAFSSIHEKDGCRELTEEEQKDMFISGTISVWVMLMGLAFENLLKGIFVARQPSPRIDGKLPAKGHDLLYLAKQAGVALTDSEKHLLISLTEYSVWKGKYSLPENSNELYQLERRSHGSARPPTFNDIHRSIEMLQILREKLILSYNQARKDLGSNEALRNGT